MNVLVIGASLNPSRVSNQAIKLLHHYNHNVMAIGRASGKIDDIDILTGLPTLSNIDTITLYVKNTIQPLYYDYISELSPRRVIFNPGTENEVFQTMLLNQGVKVEEACNLVMLKTGQF